MARASGLEKGRLVSVIIIYCTKYSVTSIWARDELSSRFSEGRRISRHLPRDNSPAIHYAKFPSHVPCEAEVALNVMCIVFDSFGPMVTGCSVVP